MPELQTIQEVRRTNMKCCAAFIKPHRTFDAKAHTKQTNKNQQQQRWLYWSEMKIGAKNELKSMMKWQSILVWRASIIRLQGILLFSSRLWWLHVSKRIGFHCAFQPERVIFSKFTASIQMVIRLVLNRSSMEMNVEMFVNEIRRSIFVIRWNSFDNFD